MCRKGGGCVEHVRCLVRCLSSVLDTAAAAAVAAGKGISNPLEINILPSKKGLGSVSKKHQHHAAGTSNKSKSKKGRGGERSRRRKAIAARHAAKEAAGDRQAKMEAATGTEGLFAFINYNLGSGSEAADKLRDAGIYGGSSSSSKQQTAGAAALASASAAAGGKPGRGQQQQQQRQQQPDRHGLVGSHDNLAEKKVSWTAATSAVGTWRKNVQELFPCVRALIPCTLGFVAAAELLLPATGTCSAADRDAATKQVQQRPGTADPGQVGSSAA
jgi:hypothetical protein